MKRGYIKLWRSSTDSDLYFSEPFTKWQAWSDLLIMANHKARCVDVRGIMITIEVGSVLASGDYLASRWKWSRGKVRRFLSYLESKTVQQIIQHKSNVCNVVTIKEWGLYQADGTADGTADGQQTDSRRTADGQQTDTPKNVKNVENGKNDENKIVVDKAPDDDFSKIIKDIYNDTRGNMPECKKITSIRKSQIRARVKEVGVDELTNIIKSCLDMPHLQGVNDRGWTADLEWITKDENFTKIIEGKYKRKRTPSNGQIITKSICPDFV